MKKLISLFILMLTLVSCSTPNQDKLVIATSSGYPPYEMINAQSGELEGFDIDLGNLIAKKLNKEVEWKDMNFDGVIASLTTNQADMAIAALSPDPKRDAAFTNAYYVSDENPFFIVTLKDSTIKSVADIQDKKVGVQVATIQESAANSLKESYNLEIDARDAYNIMIQEVLLGRLDFLIMEPLVAQNYLDEYPELAMFELSDESLDNLAGNAIALPKGSALLEQVNKAIDELKADGSIDQLIEKWFTE